MALCDVRLYNIIILGISFMLVFTAFQTCSMVEKTVLISVKNDNFNKTGNNETASNPGDGYTSLCIIYAVFSVSNWAAPSFVNFAGPKISMIVGAIMYFLFILSFLKPMEWSLYLGSVLVGFGAAILWTGQGNFLTINSDSDTVSRNSGIFWALLQCSLLFGNMYSYFVFKGKDGITSKDRTDLFIGLSAAALLGILTLLLLRRKRNTDSENLVNLNSSATSEVSDSPLQSLKRSFQLLKTREMILLSAAFAYTGLELTFFSGVYGASISNNKHFGADRNGLLGLSGILIGAGEIIGGSVFGLFGKRTNKYGRDPIVLMGYLVHVTAFYLIFINIPQSAPTAETMDSTYITSNKAIALLCSFLLGLGDSCFNTQIYSLLGYMFPEDSSPAFALFKFVQSIAAAVAFGYSNVLVLEWQLFILILSGTVGCICFNIIEWQNSWAVKNGYQTI